MIRKTFVLFCIVVVALAWSASLVSAQSNGFLRIKNAHAIQIGATETAWINVEFGAKHEPLNDVAIVCHVSPNEADVMRPEIFGENQGPFSISNNFYGRDVVFGSYRQPPTLDIPPGQSYSVDFYVRLLNVPAGYQGVVGGVQCELSADAFATVVDTDDVVIKVR